MRTNKELLKTIVLFSETMTIETVDTIDYENKWWLVVDWLDNTLEKWSTPKRIICIDSFPHQKYEDSVPADFHIKGLIPKELFSLPLESLPKNVVAIDMPPINVPYQND